jgi:uncharacterized protein (DUF2062 family)
MSPVRRLRSMLVQVLHLNETPHRTAVAFAVGVFICFSPTYGLHTASALLAAWAFRLNLVAILAGSFINNPWTVVPILGATLWTGFAMMGLPHVPAIQWDDVSVRALYEQLAPYVVPFLVGGFVLSLLGALLIYPVALFVITRVRERAAAGRTDCHLNPPELR